MPLVLLSPDKVQVVVWQRVWPSESSMEEEFSLPLKLYFALCLMTEPPRDMSLIQLIIEFGTTEATGPGGHGISGTPPASLKFLNMRFQREEKIWLGCLLRGLVSEISTCFMMKVASIRHALMKLV